MNGGGRFSKALERAAAVAAIWPVATLLISERFRKSWPCFAGRLAVGLGAYGLCAVIIVAIFPGGWLPILGLTAAALAYERWCARPDRGLARHHPPGSLAFAPTAACADQRFYFKQAVKYGPVFKTSSLGAPGAFGSPIACVLGHDKGLQLLRDHRDAIKTTDERRWTPFAHQIPRGFIRYMDQDDHARYRDIFRSVLGPRVIVPNLPFLRSESDRALARMAGSADGGAGVRPRDHLYDHSLATFVDLFYGIGPDAPQYDELVRLYGKFHLKKTHCAEFRGRDSAFRPIAAIVEEHGRGIARDRAENGGGRISVLSEILREHDDALDDLTLMGNLMCMLEASRTDVGGLLVWIVKMLADNSDWLDCVRDEPEDAAAAPSPLTARIIKETLRLEQSEYLARRITKDVAFDGYTFPKGWMLRICIREGHRDPAVFEKPDMFDPDRFLARTYSTSEYAPMGMDGHSCLGTHFVDAIGGTLIEALARGYELEKTGDGPHWYAHSHLEPSQDFRVRLTPRAAA